MSQFKCLTDQTLSPFVVIYVLRDQVQLQGYAGDSYIPLLMLITEPSIHMLNYSSNFDHKSETVSEPFVYIYRDKGQSSDGV